MDIKAKINELTEKVKSDKTIGEKFKKNPTATIEELIGVNLPDDQIVKIVDGIKAKVSLDKVSGALGGLFGKK